MKGIRGHKRWGRVIGSLYTPTTRKPPTEPNNKSTVITIEADERTALLKDNKGYGDTNSTLSDGYGSQSVADSSYGSEGDGCSLKGGVENINNAGVGKPKIDCCSYVQMMAFVLLLASACVIATYLLIAETRFPPPKFSLDLVHRDLWSKVPAPLEDYLNHTKVQNIVIMQTGGAGCDSYGKCLQILRGLQKQYQEDQNATQEVPFNFLIGGNKQTYEARGWNYASGLPFVAQNASLVIALIGNYTTLAPSTTQLRSILSLITESVRLKKLQKEYKIYGLQNFTNSQNDGESLFSAIHHWKNFNGILPLL